MFKLVLAHTMDPSGPFWGAHPTEKYVHPPGTTINFFHLQVFHDFGQKFSRPPMCLMGAYTGPRLWGGKTKYLKYLLI